MWLACGSRRKWAKKKVLKANKKYPSSGIREENYNLAVFRADLGEENYKEFTLIPYED